MKLAVSFQFAPGVKIPVGTLSDFGRDTVFEYDAEFLSRGINPAPFRLPLWSGVQAYDRTGNMETFGLFEDSLPDGWGRRLVDVAFRKRHGRMRVGGCISRPPPDSFTLTTVRRETSIRFSSS